MDSNEEAVAGSLAVEALTAPSAAKPGFWASVKESLHGSEQDFTEGNLNRAVALLAVPMVLEMAGESLFAIFDAFYVARLGSDALAAVGLTESMLEVVYAIAVGLAMATTALVARRIGEKNPRAAARAAVQAIVIGIVFSILFGAAGAIWAPELLSFMGAPPSTVEEGATYTRILYASMVTIMLLFLNNAIFRGAGDAATAMRALWIANSINVVLDPCFIYGLGPFPELGLTGAAVGTFIGRGAGVLYQFWRLGRGKRLAIERRDLGIDPKVIWSLVKLSAGGAGQLLIATASYIGLIRIMAGFGAAALAGYVVAIRVVIFVLLPAWGLSNAAATLVGQNLGAGKPDRAEKSVWLTGLWNMAFMTGVTVLFVLFSRPIVEIFTTDREASPIGVDALQIISYGYVFYAWGMVMMQAFNGAGDTATPTRINFFCFWLFQLPLAYALSMKTGAGLNGVFWAMALSYSLSAMVGILLFRRGKWKLKKV